MIKLRQTRRVTKCSLTRINKFCENLTDDTEIESCEVRVERLNQLLAEFILSSEAMYAFEEEEGYIDPSDEMEAFENTYYTCKAELAKVINAKCEKNPNTAEKQEFTERQNNNSNPTINVNTTSTLPVIKIPMFTGNYEDWPSFRDMFMNAVHNKPGLTAHQKFQHLRSIVEGAPFNLIKHMKVSDKNYDDAWARLENRYDNELQIINSYIESYVSLTKQNGTSVDSLRKITDRADEILRGLRSVQAESLDYWLIFILLQKLDTSVRREWARHCTDCETTYTCDNFLEFLNSYCLALEAAEPKKPVSSAKPRNSARTLLVERVVNQKSCQECEGQHYLTDCPQFLALTPNARKDVAAKHRLCFNCLRAGHGIPKCRSGRCTHCQQKHHSLLCFNSNRLPQQDLHLGQPPQQQQPQIQAQLQQPPSGVRTVSCANLELVSSMCPTARVKVADVHGNLYECKVLFDTGSQVSLVAESLVKKLGLSPSNGRVSILGVNAVSGGQTKGKVCLTLYSMYMPTKLEVTAYILPKIIADSPQPTMSMEIANKYKHLALADADFCNPNNIDILLSIGVVWKVLRSGVVQLSETLPIARETIFGWVIAGDLENLEEQSSLFSLCTSVDIDQSLKMLWEMENIQYSKTKRSLIDEEVENCFLQTTTRATDGKYVVELPFKSTDVSFGDTIAGARQRLHAMERRFSRNPSLKTSYIQFMREYESMGHMRRLRPEEIFPVSGRVFYFPHHAIVRPDAATTKLRVVFDGSHQDSFGNSLNSLMYSGPPIQRELFAVTLRFRKYPFVFSADIVKMFRMIWISSKHENFQRILWREKDDAPVQHFVLRTVTYGTSAAPFLSVRVLKQLALDYQVTHPVASKILLEDFYVDDCLHGEFSLQELIYAKKELEDLLKLAGLQLQKWRSNSWELVSQTQADNVLQSTMKLSTDEDWGKVLGLNWNPSLDKYTFRINLETPASSITKRQILSNVAKIFDPLGLISPVVVLFKMLLQQMWSLHTSWDEEAPEHITIAYRELQAELHHVEDIKIPRNLFASRKVQLHGFSDASLLAYGAVIYARSISDSGECFVNIVSSKSKIGPIKKPNIHRLELCAALTLSRLFKSVKTALQLDNAELFAWTDSQVTLRWLMSEPSKWQDYVANRTTEILDTIPAECWRYVRTHDNPADLLSRGLSPAKLVEADLWWLGPHWLRREESSWPEFPFEQSLHQEVNWELRKTKTVSVNPIVVPCLADSFANIPKNDGREESNHHCFDGRDESSRQIVPEMCSQNNGRDESNHYFNATASWSDGREESNHHSCSQLGNDGREESNRHYAACWTISQSQDTNIINCLSERYSTWQKIVRVLGYIRRFVHVYTNQPTAFSSQGLELSEYNAAKFLVIKHIQLSGYVKEITLLQSGNVITKKSNISKLCPFLDSEGLLRVGGRIKHADLSYNARHPIILPKGSELIDRLLRFYHAKYYHAGNESLFVYFRQEFWLVGAKNAIKKITRQCIPCFKQNARNETQKMADLPAVRVQQELPFMNSGCDYAGPFLLRESRRRNARSTKGYICLFICMVTKSIHLELVTDLTTNTFIAALRRFIGRRGRCSNIYSDNGTNFRGTANALDELQKLVQSKEHNALVQSALLEDNIRWHFNPAKSPHCGGIWETGVRSVKLHLKRVIGETVLTSEEMTTLLVQIEAVLNSRPLCRISDNEVDPLTPMHFLTGRSFASIPDDIIRHTPSSKNTVWEGIQNMVNGFWKRWSNEYLGSLQARTKWIVEKDNLKAGDIVLLKGSQLPSGKWLYGRVVETFKGSDGLVRIVKVKTHQGTYERHIVNVAALPIEDNDRAISNP